MEAAGVCSSKCPLSTGLPSAMESGSSCVAFASNSAKCVWFHNFRPGQLELMFPALYGKDTFVQMATGAERSLCMFMVSLTYSKIAVGNHHQSVSTH